MNEEIRALGKNVSEQYSLFYDISLYIVFIEEIWVQIYGYFRVQSLCLLGACLWLGWVQSMRELGAKYMDTFATFRKTWSDLCHVG